MGIEWDDDLFWSWFDVNWSTSRQEIREKWCLHCCSQWHWPFDLL